MFFPLLRRFRLLCAAMLLSGIFASAAAFAQQVVQRGPLGVPAQVLDETGQWTTPLPIASDHEVSMYIPDVSHPEWLASNYGSFESRGVYTLSMFTFYKTPAACRANQIAWGFSDAAHTDACLDIAYRLRQASVDRMQKTVTLKMAAMVDANGVIVPGSEVYRDITRTWAELDPNSRAAVERADAVVAHQMAIYDARQRQRP